MLLAKDKNQVYIGEIVNMSMYINQANNSF